MPAPHEELRRAPLPNAIGHVVLAFAERVLSPGDLAGLREQLWRSRTYLYVTPGPALVPTLPNQRVAEVDDVVNAVLWLASDASSHCIGQDLCISGGALLVVPRGQMRPV